MPSDHPAYAVVQRYIDHSGALDAAALEDCFAPHASLRGYLGPKLIEGEASLYIADVKRLAASGKDMSAYAASIAAFDGTDSTATATVHMHGFAGAGFVDYLHLLKDSDAWRIVSKTFTTV